MWLSAFMPLIVGALIGLVAGVLIRWVLVTGLERQAWGTGREDLSRSQRREIRRAVEQGRPVADARLAAAAVRFGEVLAASARNWHLWSNNPSRRIVLFGRFFFPLFGIAALIFGVVDRDPTELVSGAVLLGFTVLYLPVTIRWAAARRAARDQRASASIDANRRLAAFAG